MKKAFKAGWLLLVWVSAILVMIIASLMPSIAPTQAYHFDKIVHALAFFILTFLVTFVVKRRTFVWAVAVFMLLVGGAIEFLQGYVPQRTASWGDLLADGVGILLALSAARLYHSRKTR